MKKRFIACLAALVAVFIFAMAAKTGAAASTAEKPADQRVEIRSDQAAGAVHIIIDGQETVIIDQQGLHVRRDIEYGGTITDYGEKGFIEQTLKRQPEKSNGR